MSWITIEPNSLGIGRTLGVGIGRSNPGIAQSIERAQALELLARHVAAALGDRVIAAARIVGFAVGLVGGFRDVSAKHTGLAPVVAIALHPTFPVLPFSLI